MIVFKLERERPALYAEENRLFYVKDRYLRLHEYASGRDVPLVSLRRGGMAGGGAGAGVLGNVIRTLHYNTFNPAEHNVLVLSDTDGGTYELMYVRARAREEGERTHAMDRWSHSRPSHAPRPTHKHSTFTTDGAGAQGQDAQDVKRGSGLAAVFVARNRFAVLDKARQLLIKNFQVGYDWKCSDDRSHQCRMGVSPPSIQSTTTCRTR